MPEQVTPTEGLPLVTIAMPVLNEALHIENCLDSLLTGTYPTDQLEILVIDGGSSDRTIELVEKFAESNQSVSLVANPDRIQAAAMNIAIQQANGEIIVRIDAHSTYKPDHVERIVEKLVADEAENVGGIQLPVGVGRFASVAAACLRSAFSMGGTAHRMACGPTYAETVYLGGWTTETLRRLGGFNPVWKINEDYELNVRLRKSGGRVMVLSELECEYSVRSTPAALAKQYFQYGFWRARTVRSHRSAARPRHAAPLVLLLALVASFIVAGLGSAYGYIVPGAYLLTLLVFGTKVLVSERTLNAVLAPAVFGIIHLSFGLGLAVGAIRWLFRPAGRHETAVK